MSTKSVLETKTVKKQLPKPTGVEVNSIANNEEQTFPTEDAEINVCANN